MDITAFPLTSDRWRDLEAIFEARGCSMARGCWCMYFRETGKLNLPEGMKPPAFRKQQMQALVAAGPPPGLLGYQGREPVGWVAFADRAHYPKLQRSPVARPVDDQPVWSVTCFVVPSRFRHQGVATALLHAAIDYARGQGVRVLEAYPADKSGPTDDNWLWYGPLGMYEKAGFVEVARRRPERPVVRRTLVKHD